MTKISNVGKVVIVAIIAAVLIILAIVYGNKPSSPEKNSGGLVNATSGVPQTQEPSSGTKPTASGSKYNPPFSINIVTPVAKDIWKVNTQNVISWNREGGISGDIYLIDAATKAFVGTI